MNFRSTWEHVSQHNTNEFGDQDHGESGSLAPEFSNVRLAHGSVSGIGIPRGVARDKVRKHISPIFHQEADAERAEKDGGFACAESSGRKILADLINKHKI